MKIKSFIVDAFTTELFKGNQAGVCLLEQPISEEKMILIAKEFGFSETAFVMPLTDNKYSIRYFSPKMEIPLCGHATMASAKALFSGEEQLHKIIFNTHSGYTVEVRKQGVNIEMSFPLLEIENTTLSKEIVDALGIKEVLSCGYNKEHNIVMVEIQDGVELAALSPDFNRLRNIDTGINGVVVTASSCIEGYDYEYRYFWPWSGTDEDPVTGAVQSFLAPYWYIRLDKKVLKAFQCSERTGSMEVELTEDKVIIKSCAVIFSEGIITI
ncbi:PhzF family phenazine biosynthesis protein [Myroides odoratimimus]|uniref:PhzF family phenazine biosynthesis protein n=1 Tax=Myroides odoratimimus TaxID=76832 RepID=UPI002578ED7C|nr:PhzF family phenazine biosynthesis protein [Myroides odoratimimus]MDM1094800.1 PhzF family phenazine biosynthesis protein [Myroides odoratimimus]